MHILEDRIRRDGRVLPGGVLKVDSFLNHQMDTQLYGEMAREFHRLFAGENVTRILTVEASGIGLACICGQEFGCPVLFAKKSKTSNLSGEFFSAEAVSFTHGGAVNTLLVSRDYISPDDSVLIIDDFLAKGEALTALISIVRQAGARVAGCGVAIEKAFQSGGDRIRSEGVRVEALARIAAMDEANGVTFL